MMAAGSDILRLSLGLIGFVYLLQTVHTYTINMIAVEASIK